MLKFPSETDICMYYIYAVAQRSTHIHLYIYIGWIYPVGPPYVFIWSRAWRQGKEDAPWPPAQRGASFTRHRSERKSERPYSSSREQAEPKSILYSSVLSARLYVAHTDTHKPSKYMYISMNIRYTKKTKKTMEKVND